MTLATTIFHALTEPLTSPVVARAAGELALLGVVAGVLGTWVVLWGLSYSAESLAHAMFPGLVMAALTGIPLLVGGAMGLLVAALAIAAVGRIDGLDRDVAVAVVITTLLGLGVLLGLSPRTPAGLGSLLFGDVLGVGAGDLLIAAALGVVCLAVLGVLHPTLTAVGFDRSSAGGRTSATADVVLTLLLALATLVAVQALGNLLVVATLVGPAATARVLTSRLGPMIVLATATAVVTALAGLYVSYYAAVAAGAAVTAAIVVAYLLALVVRAVRDARPTAVAAP